MEKKVALVTGSSRGIGFAIGTRLLVEDYSVIFNGVSAPDLPDDKREIIQGIQKENSGSFGYVQADVSTVEGRQVMLDFIEQDLGSRIDLLVNNAGMAPPVRKDILDLSPEEYRVLMGVNLEGPFFLTQSVAKMMLGLKTAGKIPAYNPCIVNISSISAYTASPDRAAYCISKAGVSMMTALYADRLAEYGIGVFEIRPGIIATDMTSVVKDKYDKLIAEGLTPIKRWGQPEDIARAVGAIAEGRLDFSTGQVINVDGGFHLRRL